MKDNRMKNVILIATVGLLMTACSGHIKTPALSFGKKCAETKRTGRNSMEHEGKRKKRQGARQEDN